MKVGKITKHRSQSYQFRVSSVKDLAIIINHFDKYCLNTQKQADYELFKQAFYLIQNKEHLKKDGLHKIIAIKASMNLGLSDSLKEAFSSIVPVQRSKVDNISVRDPYWIAGFTSGEGCFFFINIKKSQTTTLGYVVALMFQLTQHSRDELLMRSLIEFFKCGSVRFYGEAISFRVEKFSDIINIIIPFFTKYPILGVKTKDFQDWCKVAELINDKKHLTREGLENIRKIKAEMNKGRSYEESETSKVLFKKKIITLKLILQ